MALIQDRSTLAADLTRLGLSEGRDVLVQSSLRRLGYILGGPRTVAEAIRDVVGPVATIVVPTQTAGNSLTSPAYRAATHGMTPIEQADYEAKMPGFDPQVTESQDMGALAEYVRRRPDAVRSGHPQTSFAAWGPKASGFMRVHDLASHLGEQSPLAALYDSDAQVLLLGVEYDVCIAFHLAEYRLRVPVAWRAYTCFVMRDGRRERVVFDAPFIHDSDFARLGADLAGRVPVRAGRVGRSKNSRVFDIRPAVDFAIAWMEDNRGPKRW
jgi:aminoglycoside 3-N-acetyltransferase